ncbi:hypothetical protein BVC80_717g19 [Macleaya cordata]|uniref:Uncharacterized protein n=1 Tax=Macleaya cordata TaxID=56857 RepID=A0A200PM67_MACCD|nr:hypothetical protein BVC80_717g19 [Macleaya cordata]
MKRQVPANLDSSELHENPYSQLFGVLQILTCLKLEALQSKKNKSVSSHKAKSLGTRILSVMASNENPPNSLTTIYSKFPESRSLALAIPVSIPGYRASHRNNNQTN